MSSGGNDPILALRQALAAMPSNLELRALLAGLLLDSGRAVEAETEYRLALEAGAEREDLALGLVRALGAQDKIAAALAALEPFASRADASAALLLEHARTLLASNHPVRAAEQYRKAIAKDAAVAEEFLARRLGIVLPRDGETTVVDGRERAAVGAHPASEGESFVEAERPKVTFHDVGGMDKVKEEIRLKIIHPLKNPDLYRAYGKKIGGGILLYGPPGCGKTHIARATAGEASAAFMAIGIHDVLEMWIGQSERNLHAVFEDGRRRKPCVLFFDEVDALGARRADMQSGAGRHVINQFLAELDGVETANDGLLVLAATNAPWHLDSAFLRTGRFDRVVFVPPPDAVARTRILELHCVGKPTADLDLAVVAKKTEDLSGADLKAVVDLAVEAKLSAAMKGGEPTPLRTSDLIAAAKQVRPTTREWFATARNYVLYSNQGGLYDDVRAHLGLK